MCLLSGLVEDTIPEGVEHIKSETKKLYMDNVAKFYRAWYISEPFDIGQSTTLALKPLVKNCKYVRSVAISKKRN